MPGDSNSTRPSSSVGSPEGETEQEEEEERDAGIVEEEEEEDNDDDDHVKELREKREVLKQVCGFGMDGALVIEETKTKKTKKNTKKNFPYLIVLFINFIIYGSPTLFGQNISYYKISVFIKY